MQSDLCCVLYVNPLLVFSRYRHERHPNIKYRYDSILNMASTLSRVCMDMGMYQGMY